MAANQSSTESMRFFKLIGKAEKADQKTNRCIVEVVKNGDKYENGEWYSSLSGRISSIDVKEYMYENKPKKKVSIRIKDGNETFSLEFNLSNAVYGLINSMLQTDFSKNVEISAWISKKTGYVGSGIKYVGESKDIPWTITDLPKAKEIPLESGEVIKDSSGVVKFWLTKIEEVAAKVGSTPVNEVLGVTDDDLDGMPF